MRYFVYEAPTFQDDLPGVYRDRVNRLAQELDGSSSLLSRFDRYPRPFSKGRFGNL